MGEAMKQMADVKYSLDDNIKQSFLEPLHHLQTKDLKEVMVSYLPLSETLIALVIRGELTAKRVGTHSRNAQRNYHGIRKNKVSVLPSLSLLDEITLLSAGWQYREFEFDTW